MTDQARVSPGQATGATEKIVDATSTDSVEVPGDLRPSPDTEVYGAGLTRAEKVYGAGLTKRVRSTKAVMEHRRESLIEITRQAQPASVRHIYYRAVVAGLVPKDHNGYVKVQRELLKLRRGGQIPFSWITDVSRAAHHPIVDTSARSAIAYLAQTYRRDPWFLHSIRCEIWTESESLAGVLMPLKDELAVPIFPCKGQSSETFAWDAAQEYRRYEKVLIFYAGDYDPAGLQIRSQLEGKLREYAADPDRIEFRHLSITAEMAQAFQQLGNRPKQGHWIDYDGQKHKFDGLTVEGEAVDPVRLRGMFDAEIRAAAEAITGLDIFAENTLVEERELRYLADLADGGGLR